jgi:predicted RNase H-like nuclease (RuvC/YqgF family)
MSEYNNENSQSENIASNTDDKREVVDRAKRNYQVYKEVSSLTVKIQEIELEEKKELEQLRKEFKNKADKLKNRYNRKIENIEDKIFNLMNS